MMDPMSKEKRLKKEKSEKLRGPGDLIVVRNRRSHRRRPNSSQGTLGMRLATSRPDVDGSSTAWDRRERRYECLLPEP